MDLISRKSVAEKMAQRRDYVGRPSDPDCIIADEPSVPAVPLDKLCERLLNFSECPSCAECKLYGIKCGEYGPCGSKEHWMAVLTKWMEGLDAAD